MKCSSTGQPLWTNTFNGSPGSTDAYPMAAGVDTNGNVIVTGASRREVNLDVIDDVLTIKYSAAGTALWTNVLEQSWGHGQDMAQAMDASGNVFVTGPFTLAKLSAAGSLIWSKPYLGWLHLNSVAVDGAGNVFVNGYTTTSLNDISQVTIKYSSVGVPAWTNILPSTQFAITAMAAEPNGNLFLSWSPPSGANRDWMTIKYAAELAPPTLMIQRFANSVVLSWTNAAFGLQSAPSVTGTFTNVPGASSPYTNAIPGG